MDTEPALLGVGEQTHRKLESSALDTFLQLKIGISSWYFPLLP